MLHIEIAFSGYIFCALLLAGIGPQAVFVFRQGLLGRDIGFVCSLCVALDVLLISLGIFGLAAVIGSSPGLEALLTHAGAAFLCVYGLRSIAQAADVMPRNGTDFGAEAAAPRTLLRSLTLCLAVSLANPHVFIDTVLLVGGVGAASESPSAFAVGALAASVTFFFGLGYFAVWLRPAFASEQAWRRLDLLVGVLMIGIAVQLVLA